MALHSFAKPAESAPVRRPANSLIATGMPKGLGCEGVRLGGVRLGGRGGVAKTEMGSVGTEGVGRCVGWGGERAVRVGQEEQSPLSQQRQRKRASKPIKGGQRTQHKYPPKQNANNQRMKSNLQQQEEKKGKQVRRYLGTSPSRQWRSCQRPGAPAPWSTRRLESHSGVSQPQHSVRLGQRQGMKERSFG